ncbi:class I SAM-dependent methyltransferase [Solimonas fluminis]|nr:class I SAM-dependent methyltransferase [Solimonas fluminis]
MSDTRPSSTALGAAMMRAAHLLLDQAPWLLEDPLALPLSGLSGEGALRGAVARLQAEFAQRSDEDFAAVILRDLRATILLRNRYAEDELERAMAQGLRQYVMLGAGLDSFALRRPDLAARLDIFELDLPATQDWKRQRLQQLGLALPRSLHFVPADLERRTPLQALAGSAFRPGERAFFSWLGVTSYLSEAAVYGTLRGLAALAPGSAVVFSYGLQESLVGETGRRIGAVLKAGVAARHESAAHDGFDPAALSERLRGLGYSSLESLDVAAAQARYFSQRRDGLQSPPMTQMMRGVV